MPGAKKLRRLQYGFETTPGTLVAATRRWRGPVETLDDARAWEFVEEDVGILGGTDRKVLAYAQGNVDLKECQACPEQFAVLPAWSLGGPIAGTADGTGSSGFRYVTTIPTTARPANNRAASVEAGDDQEVESGAYGKVVEFALKGVQQKPIMMSGKMQTNPVARLGAGFSATTLPVLDDLVFWNTRLYLDLIAGTIGTTQITGTFLGFELSVKPVLVFKQTGEGAAAGTTPTYNLVVYVDHKIDIKLTFENDPVVDGNTGLRAAFRTGAQRLMRLDCLGRAYTTPGTSTLFSGRQGIRADLPITITKVPPLSDISGNNTVTIEAAARYNNTFGSAGSITVCNELSTL